MYREVRELIEEEMPELIGRHQERMTALDELDLLLQQLRATREERGLS